MGAAARPGMGCRCPLQRRVARQKKKLILERGCVLGFLEGEVQIDIVVSKKRPQGVSPTANPAQRVAVGKEEQSGFCSDVSLRYKIDTRYKRERKGKIKKRARDAACVQARPGANGDTELFKKSRNIKA